MIENIRYVQGKNTGNITHINIDSKKLSSRGLRVLEATKRKKDDIYLLSIRVLLDESFAMNTIIAFSQSDYYLNEKYLQLRQLVRNTDGVFVEFKDLYLRSNYFTFYLTATDFDYVDRRRAILEI